MSQRAGRWRVERLAGSAAEIHAREVAPGAGSAVWVVEASEPALVLGSTQPASTVDQAGAERAGIAVVRRRSGGGAVLVDPAALVWVDVFVPAGDRLWRADVGRAPLWLGEVWAQVCRRFGVAAAVHTAALAPDPLARSVCFAGRAPGEVISGSAKVVGIAQRRTRAWARFQCAALLAWEPESLLELLAPLAPGDRARVRAAGRGLAVGGPEVVAAFLDAIAAR